MGTDHNEPTNVYQLRPAEGAVGTVPARRDPHAPPPAGTCLRANW